MSGREKYNIGGVDKEGHRYMNVRCPVHIFFTALSAQIIIEAFIREAFLFPRRLAGFQCISVFQPKEKGCESCLGLFYCEYSKVLDHVHYFQFQKLTTDVSAAGDSIIVWKQPDRIISAGMGMIRKDKRMTLIGKNKSQQKHLVHGMDIEQINVIKC